jgi:hypothetical protein
VLTVLAAMTHPSLEWGLMVDLGWVSEPVSVPVLVLARGPVPMAAMAAMALMGPHPTPQRVVHLVVQPFTVVCVVVAPDCTKPVGT